MVVTVASVLLLLLGLSSVPLVDCECEEVTPSGETKPVPELDEQFQATMIVTRPQKDYLAEVVEYYDHKNNKGALHVFKDGKTILQLNNFETNERFEISDGSCTKDLSEGLEQFFEVKDGQVQPYSDIIKLGEKYDTVYVGNDKIGTIDVDHWATCVNTQQSRNYTTHFYFTLPDYVSPAGKRRIPVKFESIDKADEDFHTVYDFPPLYKPGPISDSTVFELPHGIVCERETVIKPLPNNLDAFTAHMEFIYPDSKHIDHAFYAFDYEMKLTRNDVTPSVGSTIKWPFYDRATTLIHDFSTGLEYAIDIKERNCSIQAIEYGDDMGTDDANHLIMKHGRELFHFSALNFSYQGQRAWRSIYSDVWATHKQDFPDEGTETTMEVYFAPGWNSSTDADELPVGPDTKDNPNFIGMWIGSKDDKPNMDEKFVHLYDYSPAHPDQSFFDIGECYETRDQMIHAVFRIEEKYETVVGHKTHVLTPLVWRQIADTCDIEFVRIANIYFDAATEDYTDVWFTIYEKSDKENKKIKNPRVKISMKQAYDNLKEKIDSKDGFVIKIDLESKQDLKVKKGSLQTDEHIFDPRPDPKKPTVVNKGHSNGAMAGLGICMLILGAVVGIIGLILWQRRRRNRGIPYSRDI